MSNVLPNDINNMLSEEQRNTLSSILAQGILQPIATSIGSSIIPPQESTLDASGNLNIVYQFSNENSGGNLSWPSIPNISPLNNTTRGTEGDNEDTQDDEDNNNSEN